MPAGHEVSSEALWVFVRSTVHYASRGGRWKGRSACGRDVAEPVLQEGPKGERRLVVMVGAPRRVAPVPRRCGALRTSTVKRDGDFSPVARLTCAGDSPRRCSLLARGGAASTLVPTGGRWHGSRVQVCLYPSFPTLCASLSAKEVSRRRGALRGGGLE